MRRKHREAILGKVSVKGESQAKSEALHRRKTDGISKRKVLVIVLNLFCSFLISGARPNNHGVALLHIFEKLGCLGSAKHREDQRMGFDQ
jgi:hypothetical protein